MYTEENESISIHDRYVKVPYTYNNRLYYMILPIDISKTQLDALHTYHHKHTKTSGSESIYYNDIIEVELRVSGEKEDIGISNILEKYMGPDQCYKNQTEFIKVRDVVPPKYHSSFQYLRILYDDLESVTKKELDDLLFDRLGSNID